MGTGGALVEPRVDRGAVLDLAAHLDRAVRDRGRNRRAVDLRRHHRLGRARDRRVLDQIPLRRRRDRADVRRRRGARSGGVQAQREGGGRGQPRELFLSVSRLRGGPLGLIFAPFTMKTGIFVGGGIAAFVVLPWLTPRFFRRYGNRPSELEAKYPPLCLLVLGALATWADSEAVLPAYVIGMALAGTGGKGHPLICRLRTLTFGVLTPFYFIRARSFASIPELVAAPAAFVFMLVVKIFSKIVGVYPVTKVYKAPNKEAMYTTLLMSTGLTFGTISALFGLSRGIIDQGQYSALVAAVIASAVIPTVIANAFYLPRHLL